MGKKLKALKQRLFGRSAASYQLLDSSKAEPKRSHSVSVFDDAQRSHQAAQQLAASPASTEVSTTITTTLIK